MQSFEFFEILHFFVKKFYEFIKPKYIFVYLYIINHRNGGNCMDTKTIYELISEAKSIGILLESDMQISRQDETFINAVKAINRILNLVIEKVK